MKQIHTTFFFEGSAKEPYQTIVYTDGSLSCNCPGWTRRVQPDGTRSCKHTRTVAAGLGEQNAIRVLRNINGKIPEHKPEPVSQPMLATKTGRAFDFSL